MVVKSLQHTFWRFYIFLINNHLIFMLGKSATFEILLYTKSNVISVYISVQNCSN